MRLDGAGQEYMDLFPASMFYDKRRMLAMSAFWDEAVSHNSVKHQESHLQNPHGCANFSGGVGARVSLTLGAGAVSGR